MRNGEAAHLQQRLAHVVRIGGGDHVAGGVAHGGGHVAAEHGHEQLCVVDVVGLEADSGPGPAIDGGAEAFQGLRGPLDVLDDLPVHGAEGVVGPDSHAQAVRPLILAAGLRARSAEARMRVPASRLSESVEVATQVAMGPAHGQVDLGHDVLARRQVAACADQAHSSLVAEHAVEVARRTDRAADVAADLEGREAAATAAAAPPEEPPGCAPGSRGCWSCRRRR
jgi:hypothetical protein